MDNAHAEIPNANITFSGSASETKMNEAKKRVIYEKLWLQYFNEVLYLQKIITEEERNKMNRKINER